MADANYELHYAVLGAGAMGYRYGVLLKELAGKKVDFVDCWQPNVDAAQARGGVTVSRDHENRHVVPVNVYTPEQYQGDPDVWIVMVKQMQLADVLERCAKAGLFKDHQVVFSAMNGWGHFEKLQKYFKDENIYGGTAMVATVMNGPADVDFIGKPGAGAMRLVSMTGEKTLVEQQMFDDFKAANFNPSYGNDLKGTCMAKVIFNSVVNTLCTMYQIQMGQFIEYPGALDMAKQLIDEAYDACRRRARPGPPARAPRRRVRLARGESPALPLDVPRPHQGPRDRGRLHQRLHREARPPKRLPLQDPRVPHARRSPRRDGVRHPPSRALLSRGGLTWQEVHPKTPNSHTADAFGPKTAKMRPLCGS